MSFNLTYIAAEPAYAPTGEDFDRLISHLKRTKVYEPSLSDDVPRFGHSYLCAPGPRISEVIGGEYPDPTDKRWAITLNMTQEPELVGDDGGPAFETRFYLCFKDSVFPSDDFLNELSEILGTTLFTWIGHY